MSFCAAEVEPTYGGEISLTVDKWKELQLEQRSDTHRIGGFPWSLRLRKGENGLRHLDVKCEMSTLAALWECDAYVEAWGSDDYFLNDSYRFCSWEKNNDYRCIMTGSFEEETVLNVRIGTFETAEKWCHYSTQKPYDLQDGTVKIEGTEIPVNKSTLASQSPVFTNLFYGNEEKKNLAKFALSDVTCKEFKNLLQIIYGKDASLVDDFNCEYELKLADKLDLKIAQDRVVSFLLSESCQTIRQKLRISDQFNIPFLMTNLLRVATTADLKDVTSPDSLEHLSNETVRIVMSRVLDQLSPETVRTIVTGCGQKLV